MKKYIVKYIGVRYPEDDIAIYTWLIKDNKGNKVEIELCEFYDIMNHIFGISVLWNGILDFEEYYSSRRDRDKILKILYERYGDIPELVKEFKSFLE